MADQPRRFVHDEQIGVLVDDFKQIVHGVGLRAEVTPAFLSAGWEAFSLPVTRLKVSPPAGWKAGVTRITCQRAGLA